MKLRSLIVFSMALAVLAAACGRSDFSFIEQPDEGIFLKVPDDWTVFETTKYEPPPQTFGDLFARELAAEPTPWQIIIDGGPEPTATNFTSPLYAYPIGLAEVQPISPELRDEFNTSLMRQLATGFQFDPVIDPPEDTRVVVELDQDLIQDNLRGNRVRFSLSFENSTVVIDSLVLLDGINSRWYRVTFRCEENCYLANASLIDEIMTSFTVES